MSVAAMQIAQKKVSAHQSYWCDVTPVLELGEVVFYLVALPVDILVVGKGCCGFGLKECKQ